MITNEGVLNYDNNQIDRAPYEERIPLGTTVGYVEVGKREVYILFRNGLFATLTPRITDALEAESNAVTASAVHAKKQIRALEAQRCFECSSNPKPEHFAYFRHKDCFILECRLLRQTSETNRQVG